MKSNYLSILIILFTTGLFFTSCEEVYEYFDSSSRKNPVDTMLYSVPTKIEFSDTVMDIGTIKEGDKPQLVYHLKNTGSNPLVLFNVIPGCGCTVASYSFKPILPGMTDSIVANFDSDNKEGPYIKIITVQANTEKKLHKLYFKVNVEK